MDGVSETLQVAAQDGKVIVTVLAENRSAQTVYLPRTLVGDKTLSGALFTVREGVNGDPLVYTGRMVKRGPLGKGDYLALAPHATLSNSIDITHSYGFLPGKHRYRLAYEGQVVADLDRLGDVQSIAVEPVVFSYTVN